jgi:hypothetical protein
VRGMAPDELTALLVKAGARITEVIGERQTLEDVVLSVTSAGSDRVAGGTTRRGRAGKRGS